VIRRLLPAICAALALAGCNPSLPEPESPGARLLTARCGTCHRLYAPQALTFPMWEMMIDRMQGEMARRGVPPLDSGERALLTAYLKKHAQTATP